MREAANQHNIFIRTRVCGGYRHLLSSQKLSALHKSGGTHQVQAAPALRPRTGPPDNDPSRRNAHHAPNRPAHRPKHSKTGRERFQAANPDAGTCSQNPETRQAYAR